MTQTEKAKLAINKTQENVVKTKTALTSLANKIQVSPESLQKVLMTTVCKNMKTNEEFITFVSVANQYNLNPLLNEIYAFPDKKGGIVPIVSTDGWTRIMTTHPDYKSHGYRYSETKINIKGKEYPEWCECIISKKDNTEIVIREYLDEVYRDVIKKKDSSGKWYEIQTPWQTHTMRMFRHKTKIQAAREAFGFSNIYDKDEGERIIEAQTVEIEQKMPQIENKEQEQPDESQEQQPEKINQTNIAHLMATCTEYKITDKRLKDYLRENIGVESKKDILVEYFDLVINDIKNGKVK
jgi:phage recombination protein Bet